MAVDLGEALRVMETERACVLRNESGECNRDCGSCDLVLPSSLILESYDFVIKALSNYSLIYADDGK